MANPTATTETRDNDEIFGKILPVREGYPPAELGLMIAIVLAGRRWRALLDEKLRQLGHSASRMEAMAAIAYSPAATTQIQIAKRIGIEGPTLTRTLDMLEADALVERLPDPSDRRNTGNCWTISPRPIFAAIWASSHCCSNGSRADWPCPRTSEADAGQQTGERQACAIR